METRLSHTASEIGNEFACQKHIRRWIERPAWPSSQVIPVLHKELMFGVNSYSEKGIVPLEAGSYRMENLLVGNEPENFYAQGLDVQPAMTTFTQRFDEIIRSLPHHPEGNIERIIHEAAWAYYVFTRIHPFLDGNGRIGRMILKRVLAGSGLKDLIFHGNGLNGHSRAAHLDAMKAIDRSGNLAHLELYLLQQQRLRYADGENANLLGEIDEVIKKKRKAIVLQSKTSPLENVWEGFRGMYLAGVSEPPFTYDQY